MVLRRVHYSKTEGIIVMHYAKGDIVLYGLNGACQIKAIESREQGVY